MSAEITVAGETLALFAERAAYWKRARTLLVADPHFGKAAAFRAGTIPVPRGTTTEALARLDTLIASTDARRIIVLGDFLHAKEGRAPETLRTMGEWRERRRDLELVLVRGNHDRRAGDPSAELGIGTVDAPMIEPPFAFAHHPAEHDGGYVIAGHLHPGVRLFGPGGLRARVPCFWFGDRVAVLPAFGDFTGMAPISPMPDDKVFAIAESEVLEVRIEARDAERDPSLRIQ
jgi:DNA ligase-associated metallophosphoesterase